MNEISNQVIEAIKKAIQMEVDGRNFYEHVAASTDNELGKKMFLRLAQDEKDHLHAFSEMFTVMTGSDDWKRFVSERDDNKHVLVEKLRARAGEKGKEASASDLEALRMGMEMEREGIDYYEKAANAAADAKARTIFMTIREEEEVHYALLQAELDALTGGGFWFDSAEFSMEGQ